jgi:GNAT superfamily N-acetyltransferase
MCGLEGRQSEGYNMNRQIVTTVDRPDLIDIAAEWIWNAFWKKDGYTLEQLRAMVISSDAVIGPNQCMLLLVDGVPVGTAGLIKSDLVGDLAQGIGDSRPELTPWLAAMYVRPDSRGRGYALELIRAVESAAVLAGYNHLWLYTLVAEGLYLKAGWRSVERFEVNGVQAVLMRRDF